MANRKKQIDSQIVGPAKAQTNTPMAFDGPTGKLAKELPDGALTVEKIEPLQPQKVVVTETNGTLAVSNISTTELGYLRGLDKNILAAIQEIVNVKPSSYPVIWAYASLAGAGRYLERFSGMDASEAPDFVPENGNITSISITTSNTLNDFTIGIYLSTDLGNPISTHTIPAGIKYSRVKDLKILVLANALLLVKVISGARIKPMVTYYIETSNL